MIRRPLGLGCLAAAVFLYFYARLAGTPYIDYSEFQGERVTVMGKVYKKEAAMQINGPVSVLYLDLEKGNCAGNQEEAADPGGEKVICYLKPGQPEAEMGSLVRLEGKLACFERASNPGQFDACSYYQISGISYRLTQAEIKAKTTKYNKLAQGLYQLRSFFSQKLEERLDEEEASVMQTMLLGEKSNMDKELKALYQRNGIAHILAISGLHISLLGMGLYRLLRSCGIPMKISAGFSAGVMICYGMMTGFSISAVRAILMFVIHMAAVILERTYDMLTAVAASGVLLLLQQPLYFFHSGFIFSFGCVLGIGLLLPALTEIVQTRHTIVRAAAGGIGMTVITLPVYLWFYYQYPVCSVFLNLMVIPLMSFLMAAGILLGVSLIICPQCSFLFALPVKGILGLYKILLNLCDGLPGSFLSTGRPEEWQIILYLMLLVLIIIAGKRLRPGARWGIVLLAVLVLLIHPHKEVRITFLDVGQGDGICISNNNGNHYLVDGGSSTVNQAGQYRIIPFLKYQGISHLKAVFVTHPDEDHCNGIRELIDTGKEHGIWMDHLVLPDVAQEAKNQAYLELEQLAGEAGILVSYISRGQEVSDGQLTMSCLHPEKGDSYASANEYSMVMKVTCGNFSAMLTGDVEGAGEQKLISYLEEENRQNREDGQNRLTVLKAAHHGSAYSMPVHFLESQMPLYSVISCGRNNSYGHPHEELMERLKEYTGSILITYETGAVTFITDGEKMRLEKFLNE